MNNDGVEEITKEELAVREKRLNQLYKITLKQRQWIVIYNLLVANGQQPRLYSLGEAKIVNEICDEIQKVVAVDSNIPPKKNGVLTN